MNIEKIKEEVSQFLKDYKMSYEDIDFEKETSQFTSQMNKGLSHSSSLKMIPTYIDPFSTFSYGEPIIVLDAGGTNFRRAVVTIQEDKTLVEDLQIYPMPGVKEAISKDEFFKTIVDYISPIIHKSSKIGFCFSYPVEILPNTDGRVLSMTKELKIIGIESTILGETLNSYLCQAGYKGHKKIAVLNDTSAVLLSGMGLSHDYKYDSFVGLILGTGSNTCYIEMNKSVLKDKTLVNKEGHNLINIESGGYSPLFRGAIDEILDRKSRDSGKQLFEKMVSGAYQGSLVFQALISAGKEGLLTKEVIEKVVSISSKDLSDFLLNPFSNEKSLSQAINKYGTYEDRIKIYLIINQLIERGAKLLAINVKAILKKADKGKNPCEPVCLTIDGSTFYGSPVFQNKFDYYIKTHLENEGFYIRRIKVENGTLIGAAMAALMAFSVERQ